MKAYKSDIEIAQEAKMLHIKEIAAKLNLGEEDFEYYGKYKAKIELSLLKRKNNKKNGKLILTTAINPTPAGEGKSTTTVGLGDAINKLGKNCVIALREPSLGPCFGVKGGAAGGGYAQVVPMEDINLHFTGDMHAIGAAHNLLSASLDNHLKHGNELNIDTTRIVWKRVVDMNDRALRDITVGLGGKAHGVPRQDSYMITVASEVMAILCLSDSLMDLKERFGNIIVAYNYKGEAVYAKELNVQGAMAALMKDAIKPNLVQTLENNPALIHGGPFANIAHGCNSVLATKMALKMADYVVTEAGFGADLGAEKFFNIKCRLGELKPDCVVLVATARALKMHGGASKESLKNENMPALERGIENLKKHIENLRKFKLPLVVAINKFYTDTDKELKYIYDVCYEMGVKVAMSEVWEFGGEGGLELAKIVIDSIEEESKFEVLYDTNISIKSKIEKIAVEIYGADGVNYSQKAEKDILLIEKMEKDKLPICMAKTQNSLSDNPNLLGRPKDFKITVKAVNLSAGAGFLVVLTGDIMTMPGLPKKPAAENIDVDENGKITGLF